MEPPLCSSPHHLSGLTVARLRLAQLVSVENRREQRYLTILQWKACPPTLAQSSPNVISVSRTSNASLDCGILSDPPAKVIIAIISKNIIINALLD